MKDSAQISNIKTLCQRVEELEGFINFYSDEEIEGAMLRLRSKDDFYDVEIHNSTPMFLQMLDLVNGAISLLLDRITLVVNDNETKTGITEQIKYEEL